MFCIGGRVQEVVVLGGSIVVLFALSDWLQFGGDYPLLSLFQQKRRPFCFSVTKAEKRFTGFVLLWALKFHDFLWLFPWPSPVMHDLLMFSCRFRKVSKQSSEKFSKETAKRRYFFYITQFNKQRICLMTCLCHIFLALTSSVINLTNTALIFHDFPGLENEIRKFPDFQGFLRPVHPWFHEPARVIRHGLKVVVFFSFFFFSNNS